MKLSARNIIKGRVKSIEIGKEAYLVMKASNVMIAVD